MLATQLIEGRFDVYTASMRALDYQKSGKF